MDLLQHAVNQGLALGKAIKFIYPSSIAVYGIPDLQTKEVSGCVKLCTPRTMYGCNKLYCEQVGRYYSKHYRHFPQGANQGGIDFRALRFPGLVSADTVPTGGTSDYGPEMVHHAARGLAYRCFVREDSQLPFMAMPDAITALMTLEAAPIEVLSREVYNVTSFSLTAREFQTDVLQHFLRSRFGKAGNCG
jgi:nucleoside-diphosphate-sugar epimerase